MTLATPPKQSRSQSRHRVPRGRLRAHRDGRAEHGLLGRYADRHGRPREVLARPGRAGSVLVIDRDARTLGDRRLVAHLGADEPRGNAALICRHYLHDSRGRWCRPVAAEDLRSAGPGAYSLGGPCQSDESPAGAELLDADRCGERAQVSAALVDVDGRGYWLGTTSGRTSIPELRWLRTPADLDASRPNRPRDRSASPSPQAVSLREVIACLQSYEPARARTMELLARHCGDPAVSVAALRAELARMDASRIVLNRGLREAVLSAVETRGLSMSEIALRCGRVKYDARGNASGETSWLARRVGIAPEGGEREPTPWVHSDVLALIARSGLGIGPHEVELG